MKKVFILLNSLADLNFSTYIDDYLSVYSVTIGTKVPDSPNDYDIIVAWSYQQIIKNIPHPNNIIIFHSSDLPNGKGWAPIYNAIANEEEYFVITGILAAPEVDAGDVVVKAKFRIRPEYMAKNIRDYDNQISLLLIDEILRKFEKGCISGVAQIEKGTYNKKRTLSDSEIDIDKKISSLIPHLRACEDSAPPYFMYKGVKYKITIEANMKVDNSIPNDLSIKFFS